MAAVIIDMAEFFERRKALTGKPVPEYLRRTFTPAAQPASASASAPRPRGANDAATQPYDMGDSGPIDYRPCMAVRSNDIYTVLQFDDCADPANLKASAPQLLRVSAADFNTTYAPQGWLKLTQDYHDIFRAHAQDDLKRAGLHVTLCRPEIKDVHEVTEPGLWQPEETEISYTFDESGWRPINRAVQVKTGDIIIEYLGGQFECGPAQEMLQRLSPTRKAFAPSPKP